MQQNTDYDVKAPFTNPYLPSVSNDKPGASYSICIVDDDTSLSAVVERYFREKGYECYCFSSAEVALEKLKSLKCHLILSDLRLPKMSGVEFMDEVNRLKLNIPVIIMTAHASTETAIKAMTKGAFDYITKPLNFIELGVISSRAIKHYDLEKKYAELQNERQELPRFGSLIGKSRKMQELFAFLDKVAGTSANVLIAGESGTGKELVAKTLHSKSNRSKFPFVAINCSAIPSELLEAELFGYEKGAFTGAQQNRRGLFEEANKGTIFLDEIGEMPLSLQVKLLRVIQERKVKPLGTTEQKDLDIRIIAATNRDLLHEVREGRFREDLYYRLCVVPISIPPLRERAEDIPVLSEFFLVKYTKYSNSEKTFIHGFTNEAREKLLNYPWRGNVRELENTIERAVILCQDHLIGETDIQLNPTDEEENNFYKNFKELPTIDQLERQYVEYVLLKTSGHKEKAAKILGIDRKTLYRKLKFSEV